MNLRPLLEKTAPGTEAGPRPRLSLRVKLTLWIVMIFLVVQLSLAFVFELYMRRSINGFFNERYEVRFRDQARQLRPVLGAVNDEHLRVAAESVRDLLLMKHFTLQVFDSTGTLIAASARPGVPLTPGQWGEVVHADDPVVLHLPSAVLHDPDAHVARTLAGWVTAENGQRYVLTASWNDQSAQQLLGLLSTVVLVSIPIGVIAVAVSAYLISGIAVRPLREIQEVARRLEPGSLGQRLNLHPTGVEAAELQNELERARQRLEAAFAAQERFMSNVSHELKTPIAVLLAEAQTVKVGEAPRDVRAFLMSTMDELEKLGRTVDSFLLLTRVRHGKAALQDADLCLIRDVLMDSYEGCAPMAAHYGVRIDVRLPEDEHADAGVIGNCDLLRTVVDNLIRNAVRFSPKLGVVVVRAAVSGERVQLVVRDHGPGIPSEVLPRIFDRFAQSKEEERRGRGHGLGLEIALGITELHGGTISVRNVAPDDGGGCEFTVSLPLAMDA